jgi:hypothetical protein
MVLSWVTRGRYEVKSTVVISNRLPKEWGKLKRVTVSPGMAEGDTIQLLFPYITGKQID